MQVVSPLRELVEGALTFEDDMEGIFAPEDAGEGFSAPGELMGGAFLFSEAVVDRVSLPGGMIETLSPPEAASMPPPEAGGVRSRAGAKGISASRGVVESMLLPKGPTRSFLPPKVTVGRFVALWRRV